MILSLVTFVLGVVFGWLTNHWYSVSIRRPKLRVSGGGSGSDLNGSGYRFTSISFENELRHLGVNLPMTVIFGKRLKTHFGNNIVERDNARQCTARLLDKTGKHICPLWWTDGTRPLQTNEIKSGESANLLTFIRKNDKSKEFFAYKPTSVSDLVPSTADSPHFDQTMEFIIEVTYSHGTQKIQCPGKVVINYDDSFSFETTGSSGMF